VAKRSPYFFVRCVTEPIEQQLLFQQNAKISRLFVTFATDNKHFFIAFPGVKNRKYNL